MNNPDLRAPSRVSRATDYVVRHSIGDKAVYVFEKHHYALWPWAELRRQTSAAPTLVTLDAHTDLHRAFVGHAYGKFYPGSPNEVEAEKIVASEMASVHFNDEATIDMAVSHLRYDEQIDCAQRAGIIQVPAFIVLGPSIGSEVMPNEERAVGFSDNYRTDQQKRKLADAALEAEKLRPIVENIEERVPGFPGAGGYILDIDLDYFCTIAGLHPRDPTTFYDLNVFADFGVRRSQR